MAKRVKSYFNANLPSKTSLLVSKIRKVKYTLVNSELEALLLEARLIKKYRPKYNFNLKDGKNYLYLKITEFKNVPLLLKTRKRAGDGATYFGPFPDENRLKSILKILRRAFPYMTHKPQKRRCLSFHLALCPCVSNTDELKIYRRNLAYLKRVLRGKSRAVKISLEKQMRACSAKLEFEKASLAKNQWESLKYLNAFQLRPEDLENDPGFSENQNAQSAARLVEILKARGLKFGDFGNGQASRIECYDISNLAGESAAGSMVVFINGQPEKSHYRRFRIKLTRRVDDSAMIKEVLSRRFNSLKETPDLIIVDGGKGQLSAVLKVLASRNLDCPVIGLAKREELIVLPKSNGSFSNLRLENNDPALHLVMRIRDEAHRFAKKYHLLLRSKALLPPKVANSS